MLRADCIAVVAVSSSSFTASKARTHTLALRVAKNYTRGYTDTQVRDQSRIFVLCSRYQTKVRDATSNDPWGPSGMQMNEIAQMTYNQ